MWVIFLLVTVVVNWGFHVLMCVDFESVKVYPQLVFEGTKCFLVD